MDFRDRIVEFRRVPASELVENPKNWRRHGDDQRRGLRSLVEKIGFAGAELTRVLDDGRLMLIDGHLRKDEFKNQSLPVLVTDLNEHEADLLLATFDPLGAMATTDDEALESLLSEVNASFDDLGDLIADVHGNYDEPEAEPPGDPGAAIDRAEELLAKWHVERGQLWVIPSKSGRGEHRLLCGDSTNADDVVRVMAGELAHVVVTSPPYNQNLDTFKPSGMQKEQPAFVNRMAGSYMDSLPEGEYQQHQIELLEMLPRFMTSNGSIFYNHKIRYRDKAVVSPFEWLSRLSYPIRQEIIWDRGGSITLNARMFIPADERIYWLRVGDDFLFNDTTDIKSWSTVWEVAAQNELQVSAAFANEIPTRCIKASSSVGNIVLDPYGGSGTTMAVSEQLGRQCRMIELEPKYCAVILQRLADMGLNPQLASDKSPSET